MNPPIHSRRRALVELFPRYLTRRMRGWGGIEGFAQDSGLARPELVLLRNIVMETDAGAGMTEAELRANLFNPYATFERLCDYLS